MLGIFIYFDKEKLSNADIIISAAPNGVYFDTPENAEKIVLFDIGNNFEDTDSWLARTPFRGGIGPVTRVTLLYHAFYKEVERVSGPIFDHKKEIK